MSKLHKQAPEQSKANREETLLKKHSLAQEPSAERSERLLRRSEVERRTGLARSTIYEWMARGDFPASVRLGARNVAWRESDIATWIARKSGELE
jgi:prophage regulatory protein